MICRGMEQQQMTGAELRAARKILDFKHQSDLGDLLGYTNSTISRMENNKEPVPPIMALYLRNAIALKNLQRRYERDISKAQDEIEDLETKLLSARRKIREMKREAV